MQQGLFNCANRRGLRSRVRRSSPVTWPEIMSLATSAGGSPATSWRQQRKAIPGASVASAGKSRRSGRKEAGKAAPALGNSG